MREPHQFMQGLFKHMRSAKQIQKCLEILQTQHFFYSNKSAKDPHSAAGTADLHNNAFSIKVGLSAIKKLQVFDSIPFGHQSHQIKYFQLCSTLSQWYIAVFHSRVL